VLTRPCNCIVLFVSPVQPRWTRKALDTGQTVFHRENLDQGWVGVEVEPFASHATRGCIRPCPHLHSGVFWRFVGECGSPAAHSRPTVYFFRLPCAPTKYRPPPWRGSGNYLVCDGETGSGKVTSDEAVGRVTRLDRVYLIWILPYGVFSEQPNVVSTRG
jgi:hypothetical protein